MAETVQVILDDTVLRALIAKTKNVKAVRIVSDAVEYGIYQEMGTYKMAAQPFLVPALEAERPSFTRAFHSLQNVLQAEQVVEKVARDVEAGAKMRAPVDTGALKNSIHVSKGEDYL